MNRLQNYIKITLFTCLSSVKNHYNNVDCWNYRTCFLLFEGFIEFYVHLKFISLLAFSGCFFLGCFYLLIPSSPCFSSSHFSLSIPHCWISYIIILSRLVSLELSKGLEGLIELSFFCWVTILISFWGKNKNYHRYNHFLCCLLFFVLMFSCMFLSICMLKRTDGFQGYYLMFQIKVICIH